mmetsp:Transcript_14021/g.30339  ORF Transcript_14021/g.30339 Transcript_14021/m.30339 type:complete len:719 (-) Transcript_14021:1130-3286(-)|eukprot:CAMPEP_0202890642 /NCGR_PEP_ID=MMETSP1392-20130828/985_1 /ASSEMBLY_ACC=CAM_ASM_000868 /TAXON_ID=225041 /ORGANISM="Chlamydomonas chlamydogama, Strain SAG 11-48b" /LENGTH=718 /DNA_ID=CAMNT_0049574257 /DNA_START=182 /DNA_END=2338 /DNA_ORIENTATION=-
MFWKVAGFSQPSPIEQILDKEEFTLEELLDEDDIIQECKSLNGRLVAFLRERSTVEQLVRYLVEPPPADNDDPKRTYKYPFTACEVFCCEVEAVFNTLLEDADLMKLLMSLLDSPAPLNCKTAGYFGRVVGNLLVRKSSEMLQYLQDNGGVILPKLVNHVDTTSVADILKRLIGADEQSSFMFAPTYQNWLAETPLVDLLLARLAQSPLPEAQANAADILSAIAHTQPSPLGAKLMRGESIAELFQHAMAPGKHVLVPALDVCIALVEPRPGWHGAGDNGVGAEGNASRGNAGREAASAIVQHLPKLMGLLRDTSSSGIQQTPYGVLSPPLGRHRLKVVELFAVLLRCGSRESEVALLQLDAISVCLQLFKNYPFNNMLHRSVTTMLVAALSHGSQGMVQHLFEQCKLLDWIVDIPVDIRPEARAGDETHAARKPALRAGYMGHITQIAGTLESLAQPGISTSMAGCLPDGAALMVYTEKHEGWQEYLETVLHPRQELENTARWACGRPVATALAGLDSDGDEFQHDMDLEQISGLQPPLYHRYNTVDENDEDDDNEEGIDFRSYEAQMITEAIAGMDLNDNEVQGDELSPSGGHGEASQRARQQGMDDDEVLLATSDEDELSADDSTPLQGSPGMPAGQGPPRGAAFDAASPSGPAGGSDDMVIVEDEGPATVNDQDNRQSGGDQQGAASKGAGKELNDANVWKAASWSLDIPQGDT